MPWLPQCDVPRRLAGVPAVRRHGRRGAGSGRRRTRTAVGGAAELVPWFALAGGCHAASQLSQSLAEARAELNRSVAVQVGYLLLLAALILLALPLHLAGLWVIAAAVAAAELLRYVGYLVLARRVLGCAGVRMWQAHVPAAFACIGVALAIAATRWALTGAPSVALLAAEIIAGVLALALCIRVCPTPSIRADLRYRLTAAHLLGPPRSRRRRAASLVLGPPDQTLAGEER